MNTAPRLDSYSPPANTHHGSAQLGQPEHADRPTGNGRALTNMAMYSHATAMSKQTKIKQSRRSVYLDQIKRDIALLVEDDRWSGLRSVMEATGYLANHRWPTSKEYGAVVVALAAVVPMDWLKTIASAAAFERVFQRPNDGEGELAIPLSGSDLERCRRAQRAGRLANRVAS